MKDELAHYAELFGEIKTRIGRAQTRAAFSANREMLKLYWDIGRLITERQTKEGWGAGGLPRLSRDLKSELLGLKGFSERNIKRMLRFHREYPFLFSKQQRVLSELPRPEAPAKVPQAVTLLQTTDSDLVTGLSRVIPPLPWGHNLFLMERVKDLPIRLWYMHQTIE